MDSDVDALVQQAREGNGEALEQLVVRIQDRVYGLAVRMLAHPGGRGRRESRKILIKIVTHLADFKEGKLVYQLGIPHRGAIICLPRESDVPSVKSSRSSHANNLSKLVLQLLVHKAPPRRNKGLLWRNCCFPAPKLFSSVLDRKPSHCLCSERHPGLDEQPGRSHPGHQSLRPFRQRVSRGRKLLRNFMRNNCGHIDPSNRCTCAQMLPHAVRIGWIVPDKLLFSTHPSRNHQAGTTGERLEHMEEEDRVHRTLSQSPGLHCT